MTFESLVNIHLLPLKTTANPHIIFLICCLFVLKVHHVKNFVEYFKHDYIFFLIFLLGTRLMI